MFPSIGQQNDSFHSQTLQTTGKKQKEKGDNIRNYPLNIAIRGF
jgi:hypothetical protein